MEYIEKKVAVWGPHFAGKSTFLAAAYDQVHPGEVPLLGWELASTEHADGRSRAAPGEVVLRLMRNERVDFRLRLVEFPDVSQPTHETRAPGVNGILVVLDARRERLERNRRSLDELALFAEKQGWKLGRTTPVVLACNRMDADTAMDEDELASLNPAGWPATPACAPMGAGVIDAVKLLVRPLLTA